MKLKLIYSVRLIVLLLLTSCSLFKSNVQVLEHTKVKIKHLKDRDSWIVEYSFPRAVYSVAFSRPESFRSKTWTLVSPDLELKFINGIEYIFSKSGKVFNEVRVSHKSYYKDFNKDYNFFLKYSDNNVLMFTGFYDVFPILHPVNRTKGLREKPVYKPELKFYFESSDGDNVVALGKVIKDKHTFWKDEYKKGSYIYWGSSKPFQSKGLTVIVDRKVPRWITNDIEKYLPKLFTYYTEKTGFNLKYRPVIFINWNQLNLKGLGNLGSTLPGLIQLTLRRSGFKQKNKVNTEYLFEFLAHESAHLWNGQMFKRSDNYETWLNEGGADAFAFRAMKDLGIISNTRYEKLLSDAKESCLKGLSGKMTLNDSKNHNKYHNYYHCGSTIALATEKHLSKGDIFTFWKALFEKAVENGGEYGVDDYFELVESQVEDKTHLTKLKKFIYGPYTKGAKKHLEDLLN
ncbi:hypothetical protein [Halobacteriovorax sp.]|uniref:hypothetical protein n=1 Tax=Halobacteriovorax sp. TaxID=2020862 RepID=UPI0035661E36